MRTKIVKLFQFNELDDSAKEKAREWYREIKSDVSFWSEHILEEDAPTILKHLGYSLGKIYYTGFWSQGDGACFTGDWYRSDCKPDALKEYAPADVELTRIADAFTDLLKTNIDHASLNHSGHYYHAMSVSIDVYTGDEEETDSDADVATNFRNLSRDLMRWIYKTLQSEYEYQNSDEQIDESILANECEFTEDGKPA